MKDSISYYLKWATTTLSEVKIKTARLDSLILLGHATGLETGQILAHDDQLLTKKQINLFKSLIIERSKHIPITQLTQSCEFYGRFFYINSFVMSPRPETEKMIEIFLDLFKNDTDLKSLKNIYAADIGCGCGAIGITIKKEVPKIKIDLIDIDGKVIQVAKYNVVLNTLSLSTNKNNLIEGLKQRYDVLFCNLPYIPDGMSINDEAEYEPRLAIFGGPDGLNVYRDLFKQINKCQNKPLLILTEALPISHTRLSEIAYRVGYCQLISDDFIQVFKLIS